MVELGGRRLFVSARVRIAAWVLVLLAVVLFTVILVTRELLLRRVDGAVSGELTREANEFSGVAVAGMDRASGQPFAGVRELLVDYLQRRYPDQDEVLAGWVDTGTGDEVLRQ